MPEDWNPKRQLLSVIIGAAIGFVPAITLSITQTYLQQRNQQKQFLFERRIALLKDYSAALNDHGEFFNKMEELEDKADFVCHSPTPKYFAELKLVFDQERREKTRWVASVRPQAMLLMALYKRHITAPEFFDPAEPHEEISIPGLRKEHRTLKEEACDMAILERKERTGLLELIRINELQLEMLARELKTIYVDEKLKNQILSSVGEQKGKPREAF
ncbi:MAG: hypothetical protein WBL63_00980 [Candidatus Acidiferrum sp.]